MSNPESTTPSPANATASTARSGRAYATPELTRYGSLQALTAGGSKGSTEQNTGQTTKVKP